GTSVCWPDTEPEIRKIRMTERIPAEGKRSILRTCGIGSFALAVFQIELYCVQNAVDELGGFECGKAPRDLESFVDNDRVRRVGIKKLVNGETKNVAVNDRHTFDAPMFGACADLVVNLIKLVECAQNKAVSEFAGSLVTFVVAEFAPIFVRWIGTGRGNISREQHLQGKSARLAASARLSVVVKRRAQVVC